MFTIDSIAALRVQIQIWKQEGHTIAFVPTMGNLHAGHLSLVDKVRETSENCRVVVSIFVNPLQFGENEDFDTYPRTFDEDIDKLSSIGVDLVFAPPIEELYPQGRAAETHVVPPDFGDILEGASRPGFFTGVATVVNKLFNIVQPHIACFGEKDYQQLLIIRRMVEDFGMPIDILSAPIMREDDGLAMSSRNGYLGETERVQASELNRSLDHLVDETSKGTDCEYAVMHATQMLEQSGFVVDYIVIRRQRDLAVPERKDTELVALAAAWMGETRLIDNHVFERPQPPSE